MSAKEIFDKAIQLPQGDTLLVPCNDFRQQESLRVALAYHRRLWLGNSGAEFDLIVNKFSREAKTFISIVKVPRITSGFILRQDGSIQATSLKPDKLTSIVKGGLAISRMRQTMKEDGMTEQQINDYFADVPGVSKIDASECVLSPEVLDEPGDNA
jgi:hypothetical protein